MDSGPLRLSNFLVNARAQQARERNKRTGDTTMMLVYIHADYDDDDNDDDNSNNCGNG